MAFKDKMHFVYCNAAGHVKAYELTQVSENDGYFQGYLVAGTGIRTFRKDRLIAVYDSAELAQQAVTNIDDLVPFIDSKVSKVSKPYAPSVCFTGFKKARKAELELLAEISGQRIMANVGKALTFLCFGDNAGPSKMDKAREQGVLILSEEQFVRMLETGEISES